MATRGGKCEICGVAVISGSRGCVPRYCPDCKRTRQLEASRRWKAANREKYLAKRRVSRDAEADKERAKKWRRDNRDRARAYRRAIYIQKQAATNSEAVTAYRRRNPGKQAEIEARRRARLLNQFVAPVRFSDIWARDNGECQLCGRPVESEASLDHKIPLARGGTHEPANVQLAHKRCNSRKGARY